MTTCCHRRVTTCCHKYVVPFTLEQNRRQYKATKIYSSINMPEIEHFRQGQHTEYNSRIQEVHTLSRFANMTNSNENKKDFLKKKLPLFIVHSPLCLDPDCCCLESWTPLGMNVFHFYLVHYLIRCFPFANVQ